MPATAATARDRTRQVAQAQGAVIAQQAARLAGLVAGGLPPQLAADELEALTRTGISGAPDEADLRVFGANERRISDVFVTRTEFGIELVMQDTNGFRFRPLR